MSATTRRNLLEALEQVAPYDRILRAQLAVYLAVSCPDVVGLALGLDIDMVLQQEGIDWNAGAANSASLGLLV